MEHFVIIRFSVIFKDRPYEARKYSDTFKEERLDLRMKLFKKFCLWGITNQTLINFKVIILYDEKLQEKYLNELIEITKNYKYIILHKWNYNDLLIENNWLKPYFTKDSKLLITTRLDDDDIMNVNINKSFYNFINKKKQNYLNSIVSFYGGKFIYTGHKYQISPCNYKNSSIFTSLITNINSKYNIYYHDHSRINIKLIVLKLVNSWGQVNHNWHLDDTRPMRMKRKYKNIMKDITLEEIYKLFS